MLVCCFVSPTPSTPLHLMPPPGRKLFLATNSLFDYTNVVMNYVLR
jgi:hypothetical protein